MLGPMPELAVSTPEEDSKASSATLAALPVMLSVAAIVRLFWSRFMLLVLVRLRELMRL